MFTYIDCHGKTIDRGNFIVYVVKAQPSIFLIDIIGPELREVRSLDSIAESDFFENTLDSN